MPVRVAPGQMMRDWGATADPLQVQAPLRVTANTHRHKQTHTEIKHERQLGIKWLQDRISHFFKILVEIKRFQSKPSPTNQLATATETWYYSQIVVGRGGDCCSGRSVLYLRGSVRHEQSPMSRIHGHAERCLLVPRQMGAGTAKVLALPAWRGGTRLECCTEADL